MAAGRDQDAASFARRPLGGGSPPTEASEGRGAFDAALARDAIDRPRCCELRIPDRDQTWHIIYRIDPDAIVIVDVFSKKTRQTAVSVIENCQRRLKGYDRIR